MTSSDNIQDAEIVPTTVGQYVRSKFGYWAKRYVGMFSVSAPAIAAIHISRDGFAWWKVAASFGAWAIACTGACLIILAVLTIGGWWHTRRYRH